MALTGDGTSFFLLLMASGKAHSLRAHSHPTRPLTLLPLLTGFNGQRDLGFGMRIDGAREGGRGSERMGFWGCGGGERVEARLSEGGGGYWYGS